MTEESRHIQLTNQINFVPALSGPSNLNAFTIFIQNISRVNNHSTKYKRYIDMDDYTSHLESFYRRNLIICHTQKVEADEPHGNWRITVVQSECKTKLTYHVIECISS